MKKIIYILISFIIVTGCGCTNGLLNNTPSKKVEMFLTNYQILDEDVIKQLDTVIENDNTLDSEQKKEYKEIMKKHYQNLNYDIKDEKIDGDIATVEVMIEVTDYSKALSEAEEYKVRHPEDFMDENGTYSNKLFMDYRLSKIKEAKDKVKYTLYFTLTKIDDEWKLNNLTDEQESKIEGLYIY